MPTNRETLLCHYHYHYDPLDRLAACTLTEQANTQRFYLQSRLATEIQDQVQRSIFQHEDQLLAQQRRQGSIAEITLLATDQQRSVLSVLDATSPHPLAYTPYGHRVPDGGLLSLLGFNGERPDPMTGHYLLGNGYRAFNPVLMRFNSPDSWSPFGEGGLNAYSYCWGDPVNMEDRTGHVPFLQKLFRQLRSVFPTLRHSVIGGKRTESQLSLTSTLLQTDLAGRPIIKPGYGHLSEKELLRKIPKAEARVKAAQYWHDRAIKSLHKKKKSASNDMIAVLNAEFDSSLNKLNKRIEKLDNLKNAHHKNSNLEDGVHSSHTDLTFNSSTHNKYPTPTKNIRQAQD